MKSKIIGLLFWGCIQALFSQNIEPEWVRMEPTGGNDSKVFFDPFGNIITLGETYNPGPVLGMVTMKYDMEGNLLWKNKYDTPATETIQDCISDAEGSVYSLCNSSSRFVLVKYSADGDTLWTFYYNSSQPITCAARDLLTDDAGNIYVTGNIKYTEINDFGLMLLKLSPSGEILWESIYTEGSYGFTGLATRIINDTFYVWGRNGSAQGTRLCCLQVNMDGNALDFNVTQPYSDDFSTYYHIDEKGNFLIGDQCCEYKITKFDSKGGLMWQYIKPSIDTFPPNTAVARLTAISTDLNNNVYAVGPYYFNDTINIQVLTTKLDEEGNIVWERPFHSPSIHATYPFKSYINNENLIISGEASLSPPAIDFDFLLLQYNLDGVLILGGRADLNGKRNSGRWLLGNDSIIVVAGIGEPEVFLSEPVQQIVAKFNLPTSSIFQPSKSVQDIQIIPNPFRTSVALSLEHQGSPQQGVLELLDAQGRVVYQKYVSLAPGNNFIEVDAFGDLPSGLYCFRIVASGVTYVSKAIKQ